MRSPTGEFGFSLEYVVRKVYVVSVFMLFVLDICLISASFHLGSGLVQWLYWFCLLGGAWHIVTRPYYVYS